MAKKKQKTEFFGRVLWYDITTHHDYQHDTISDPKDRMGKFADYGVINISHPDVIVIKFGVEYLDQKFEIVKTVRDHTDVPRGKRVIWKVQEHLGNDNWRDVKV
jgi:hypothetical protein